MLRSGIKYTLNCKYHRLVYINMYIHNLSHQSKTWDSNSMLKYQKLPNLISKTSWESCVWPTAVVHSASGRAVPGSRTWRQQAARCRARAANPSRSSRSNRRILPATSRLKRRRVTWKWEEELRMLYVYRFPVVSQDCMRWWGWERVVWLPQPALPV